MSHPDIDLLPYRDAWPPDDPHANFKAEVANYGTGNPLPALEGLSRLTGIPVGCLARYVLVKWAASGAEAALALGPVALGQMRAHVARAEEAGTDSARLEAYAALRDMIEWIEGVGFSSSEGT